MVDYMFAFKEFFDDKIIYRVQLKPFHKRTTYYTFFFGEFSKMTQKQFNGTRKIHYDISLSQQSEQIIKDYFDEYGFEGEYVFDV